MDVLADSPLLVLFLVVGIGAAVGRIRVRGVGLGPAAALFVGLAASAIDDRLADIPDIVPNFGLVLFIYTIGLASGPAFFAGIRQAGVSIVVGAVVLLAVIGGAVAVVSAGFGFDAGARTGLFAGSQTNTPALSAALEALGPEVVAGDVTDPVVGYSLAYPLGVLAMIAAAQVSLRRTTHATRDTSHAERVGASSGNATSTTVLVRRDDLPPIGVLRTWRGEHLAFSRVERDGVVELATNDIVLRPGDRSTVIGAPDAVETFVAWAGERSERHLALDRTQFDFRRISLSRRELAGTRLSDLDLEGRYGATVTRVRRGDADLVADESFVLQLGDRLRVVGPSGRLADISELLGDSDRSLSEVDNLGFALGIALGLLLAQLAVPLPGGGEVELGLGGGPLVAALVLGTFSRTGPITWQIPHAANLTIRQLGVSLFLGGVGIRSGATFADAVVSRLGIQLLVAGLVVTVITAIASTFLIRLLRRDPIEGAGMISGIQTQPAVLAFAAERADGDPQVDAGYALVFPLSMILKLIVVQLLV